MAFVSAAENPAAAQAILDRVARTLEPDEEQTRTPPDLNPPGPNLHTLCGGVRMGNSWAREFEVRELTGSDEEILSGVSSDGDFFKKVVQLSLKSVGGAKATADTPQYLLAGDLDTVLLASRIVTFGHTWTGTYECPSHGTFTAEIDLRDIPRNECLDGDEFFEVIGSHGDVYRMMQMTGAVQYKVIDSLESANAGELTSIVLSECILEINGESLPFPATQVKKIGWKDRRMLMAELESRKVGPDTEGVKVVCPKCGQEQDARLSIAATFLS